MPSGLSIAGSLAIGALVAAQALPTSFQSSAAEADGLVGSLSRYVIEANDSLTALGARYGVDVETLARENGLDPRASLESGTTLRIDNRHIVPVPADGAIAVNIPQRMLFWRRADGVVAAFPIAAGQPSWPTPIGAFSIISKRKDPVWNVPPSIQEEMRRAGKVPVTQVPPGAENPLGDRWLGTSLENIGIHGTNAPLGIYRLGTHGCIRLHPDDVRELFDGVSLGTRGEIIYQPVLMRQFGDRVLLEVHPDLYGQAEEPAVTIRRIAAESGFGSLVDWQRVEDAVRQRAGVAVDVTRDAP
jgi:L,D-transpeptidase ErfK/SrfK